MSMYNLLFGENLASDTILSTLNLTRRDVGRFRDCFIVEDKIAVYTRNGGGNRDCWHEDNPQFGYDECENRAFQEEVKKETLTYYQCLKPCSDACACPGCVISYRLPKHPLYVSDIDDDFDSTYATIFFNFPPEFAEDLNQLGSKELRGWSPSQRWLNKIESIRNGLG